MTTQHGTSFMEAWDAIGSETGVGTFRRRLVAALPIYVTITNPDSIPGLAIELGTTEGVDIGDARGSDRIRLELRGGASAQLSLAATSPDHTDIFLTVADDISQHLIDCKDVGEAVHNLVQRFTTWQRFLRRAAGGLMSANRQLGLFGELVTLRDLLAPAVGVRDAVAAWTGPANAPQDFQVGRIAVEVKGIVHSEPQVFVIDGERQLDDHGLDALVLAHHRVLRHRQAGQSLPDLIAEFRTEIGDDIATQDRFTSSLNTYGYEDADELEYSTTGYTLRDSFHYRVHSGFPRLTETDLPNGTGGLRYSIAASACEAYLIDGDDIAGWLSEPGSAGDAATAAESAVVEYKATAWTPTAPTQNADHRRSVVQALKTEIVKTVVALLNTAGGELVIGVDDDQNITGIAADLAESGLPTDDLDTYELRLIELLRERIDGIVTQQLRISFAEHDGHQTCHLSVAPSPNPRFGRPFAANNEPSRPMFWVRTGNATNSLDGHDLIDYVANHWH
ncbi:PD-(D/E)XK motif protein [Ilumatobacter sp.]|uniref:PD-(D/E)XK motif protein n=1 Tax=Ilumatobacter sp. TaxID=1967498 RepID=UPI003750CC36